jgi:hypothetical protein
LVAAPFGALVFFALGVAAIFSEALAMAVVPIHIVTARTLDGRG